MFFVSNVHILVRFRGNKTVILQSNGAIVRQTSRNVQSQLDDKASQIVGQSFVEFGKKFVAIYNNSDAQEKVIDVLRFDKDGQAMIVGHFIQVKDRIRDQIRSDPEITRLAEKMGMNVAQQHAASMFGVTKKDGSDDSAEEETFNQLNQIVAKSLKFHDVHLVTCEPKQVIKIGAIVFQDSKEENDEEENEEEEQAAQAINQDDQQEIKERKIRFKVYSIDNTARAQSTNIEDQSSGLQMRVIVFACETTKAKDELL